MYLTYSYLLETPVNEVYARDLLMIKRAILLALARGTHSPGDPGRKREIDDKYMRFGVPEEEADWHGLPLIQARDKVEAEERLALERSRVPKKHEYRRELVEMLREGYLEDVDPAILYADDDEKKTTVSSAIEGVTSRVSGLFSGKKKS